MERVYRKRRFDGIRVTLIDQPFMTYFGEGTTVIESFIVDSSTIRADQQVCYEIQFAPILSDVRRRSTCEQIVDKVNLEVPEAKLTVDDCTYESNDFVINAVSKVEVTLQIKGKIDGLRSYRCTVNIDRRTDALSNLTCQIN